MAVDLEALQSDSSLARPPSSLAIVVDRLFFVLATLAAVSLVALVAFILYEIARQAMPAISAYGARFLVDLNWDVQKSHFGILPQIWGTLYSSLLALLIGGFVGITIAIFLTQDFMPPQLAVTFRTLIEMLAAIPSVVFGLWGIFVVIPFLRPPAAWLHEHLGGTPFFSTSLSGPGLLPAAIVLAIMILPTVAAISQDAISLVPYKIKEAAYGLGTTRWEAILKVIVPTAAGRNLQRFGAGLRPRPRGDDGPRHADRKFQSAVPVALLSRQYSGGVARVELSGGRTDRTAGADVCGVGAARDHAHRQCHRHVDPGVDLAEDGESLMSLANTQTTLALGGTSTARTINLSKIPSRRALSSTCC